MTEEDLQKFLFKVENLKNLVQSLEELPERRSLLVSCETHDQVVDLAKSWGYEIGRRWGDKD